MCGPGRNTTPSAAEFARSSTWAASRSSASASLIPSHAYVTDNFTVTHNTMVALRAMLAVVDAGGQAAMLAPTEVLAQQHHRSITEMMGELAEGGMLGGAEQGTKVVLLTGSMGAAARRQALLDLVTGEAGIVIGTHALIEDKVQFHDLGLVVVDEQHRFGVEQRDALRAKGKQPPHLLVMTATPIPRTVAMTVFGDLETSVLDQLPAGRSPIASHVVPAAGQAALPGARLGARARGGRGRPPGVRGLPAHRRRGRDGDGRRRSPPRGRGREAPAARRPGHRRAARRRARSQGCGRGPARPDAARRQGRRDAPLRRGRGGRAGRHHRHRGRRQRPQRHRDGDHGRRPVRRLPAAPAARPRRPWLGRRACACWSPRCRRPSPARARLDAVAATLDGFELSRIDLEQRREGDVLGQAQSGVRSSLRMLAVIEDEEIIAEAREEATAVVAADPELERLPELRTALDALLDEEREQYLDKG